MRKINEHCGVFGVFNNKDALNLTYLGLFSLQHRGQEASGIVSLDGKNSFCHKGLGLVSEVFKQKDDFLKLKANNAIGHVRYSTSIENTITNVEPFLFKFNDMSVGICNNGSLVNKKSLRFELEKNGAIFQSSQDSEILIHLIRRSKKTSFKEKLKESLEKLKGGFTFLVLLEDTLYGAVDSNSLRPLVIGKTKDNSYVFASETCALDQVGAKFICDIGPCEIAIANKDGLKIEKYKEPSRTAVSAMEYIYFAREDSNILGINVHSARKRCGKILAKESPCDCDIVIGVPNSSLSAASGYAEESKLPYEMGLIKNQYIARTFIKPTQKLRDNGVKMKLSAVKGVVKEKKVLLVDDSIVRGTTLNRIVKLLKNAGAKEVHVRIASPMFIFPSFYGIDLSTNEELIAANKTLDEIKDYINADSLYYLSEEGLIEAIGIKSSSKYGGLCMDSFNADYPLGLFDFEESFYKSLTDIQKEFLKNKKER